MTKTNLQRERLYGKDKKEMIPITNEENEYYEMQKFVTYAKKDLILIKMMKMNLSYTINSEIIVITHEILEELLIVFVI